MSLPVATRRLEDRIRELCARALYERNPEWSQTIHELRSAIQEHNLRVTNLTGAALIGGRPDLIVERREGPSRAEVREATAVVFKKQP